MDADALFVGVLGVFLGMWFVEAMDHRPIGFAFLVPMGIFLSWFAINLGVGIALLIGFGIGIGMGVAS